jgi:uncharacterized damage-inducible protein DinB
MSLVLHLRKMARNNAWANYRLYQACLNLPQAEFDAPRVGFFPSIKATLNHNLAVDHYYLDALTDGGRGPNAFYAFVPFEKAFDLATAQADSDKALVQFCDGLSEARLAGEIKTDRGKSGVFIERCDDLLAHLFQHQIHHRGQAHSMLSGTSVSPPQLDEYFLAYDRHARIRDAEEIGVGGPETVV